MSDQKADEYGSAAQQQYLQKLSVDREFKRLCGLRLKWSLLLSLAIAIPYGLYILLTAFSDPVISQPVSDGGIVTWGMVLVFLVIINGMICAGIYTWWANTKFDPVRKKFLQEHAAGEKADG
ncbi:DUF485 domain-containing protein [Emcibacter nanhaiensis]|uniref:DUF485 domain-containing protein n=1 Tax=Emcibacter nanhaiensis TaxID=1505037 RepID=A0A501PFH2_9PROT|nr:DUF485 domain-containing protein [Emcibacter nanhaiensis]TPD59209.1 DUF485 domain-containing protein [Emcibacter nanhaiensis]